MPHCSRLSRLKHRHTHSNKHTNTHTQTYTQKEHNNRGNQISCNLLKTQLNHREVQTVQFNTWENEKDINQNLNEEH